MGGGEGAGEGPASFCTPCPGRGHLQLADLVGPEREGPGGGDRRVLLAQGAGRRVARIDEEPLPGLGLAPIEVLEGGDRHVHLAPDLDHLRAAPLGGRKRVGDGGDGGHIGGDVLAGAPVPAGGGLDEPAVPVGERDGQAVDLELADEGGVGGDLLRQPVGPGLQLLGAEGVVEAHHRDPVINRREQRRGRSPDRRGGRLRAPPGRGGRPRWTAARGPVRRTRRR